MSEREAGDGLRRDSQKRNSKAARASDKQEAHTTHDSKPCRPRWQRPFLLAEHLMASVKLVTMTVTRKHGGFCS